MYENGYQQTGYQSGYQNAPQGNALGWDDDFEAQESTFLLLPEGDYWFEITKLEKGRHNGSDKVPPCNKAIITPFFLASASTLSASGIRSSS